MKSTFIRARCVAAAVALTLLTGCASTEVAKPAQHHAQAATTNTPTAPGGKMAMMEMKDPQAMCDMHKKMMSTKTPEERTAMMEERMKSMSTDMQNKHKAMMEKCQ